MNILIKTPHWIFCVECKNEDELKKLATQFGISVKVLPFAPVGVALQAMSQRKGERQPKSGLRRPLRRKGTSVA